MQSDRRRYELMMVPAISMRSNILECHSNPSFTKSGPCSSTYGAISGRHGPKPGAMKEHSTAVLEFIPL
eukprot:COSAG01_NODE_3900_length_5564_cov_6.249405_4_plen_69_part_00